ncbi:hypothetical protein H8R23_04620, partial [Flavobacterium sp. F-380]|nr:hypothetical protein [Flavobacterium kayseriense]
MKKFYSKNTFFCLPKIHNLLIFFLLTLLSYSSFGQTQTFTSSGTFTVPTGVTSITVQAWGAGEDGKNDTNYGGGGGGAYAERTFNVTSGNVYTIAVGARGYVGGNSSIALSTSTSVLIVKAEGGGQNAYHQGGRVSGSIGDVRYSGGDGYRSASFYGGGGGSAGNNGDGNSANISSGGAGGNGTSGIGGDGNRNFPTGGGSPGGGGGEGRSSNGLGGNGQVIVSWAPCSNAMPTGSSFQSFCSVDSPKVSDLSVSGSNIKWYSSISGTTVLSSSTSLSSGHYYASQTVSGCESVTRLDVTVNVSAGPSTIGTTICSGSSGTLSSSGCGSSFSGTQTAIGYGGTSELTTYTNANISIVFPALPVGATVTGISTKITYTSNSPSYTNELRIEATPPVALGGTKTDLQSSATSSAAGTVTDGTFGTWGTASPVGTWLFKFKETFNDASVDPDANIANVTIIVNYTMPVTVDWYTAASGGTYLGSGTPFNPVGVAGSGLANTNTAGTTIFYAACSTNPGCRTATSFTINSSPTIAAITAPAALCSGGSLNPTAPTVAANGSAVTASGWQLETGVGSGTFANLTVPYVVAFADNGKKIRYYAM